MACVLLSLPVRLLLHVLAILEKCNEVELGTLPLEDPMQMKIILSIALFHATASGQNQACQQLGESLHEQRLVEEVAELSRVMAKAGNGALQVDSQVILASAGQATIPIVVAEVSHPVLSQNRVAHSVKEMFTSLKDLLRLRMNRPRLRSVQIEPKAMKEEMLGVLNELAAMPEEHWLGTKERPSVTPALEDGVTIPSQRARTRHAIGKAMLAVPATTMAWSALYFLGVEVPFHGELAALALAGTISMPTWLPELFAWPKGQFRELTRKESFTQAEYVVRHMVHTRAQDALDWYSSYGDSIIQVHNQASAMRNAIQLVREWVESDFQTPQGSALYRLAMSQYDRYAAARLRQSGVATELDRLAVEINRAIGRAVVNPLASNQNPIVVPARLISDVMSVYSVSRADAWSLIMHRIQQTNEAVSLRVTTMPKFQTEMTNIRSVAESFLNAPSLSFPSAVRGIVDDYLRASGVLAQPYRSRVYSDQIALKLSVLFSTQEEFSPVVYARILETANEDGIAILRSQANGEPLGFSLVDRSGDYKIYWIPTTPLSRRNEELAFGAYQVIATRMGLSQAQTPLLAAAQKRLMDYLAKKNQEDQKLEQEHVQSLGATEMAIHDLFTPRSVSH